MAPRSSYQSPMQRLAFDTLILPFFFFSFFFFDSHRFAPTPQNLQRFRPIPVETGTNTVETATETGRLGPKQLPKQAEMGSDCHSSASCGLVRGKKNRRRRRKKKIRRHRKMDGRRIKVCNKRIYIK